MGSGTSSTKVQRIHSHSVDNRSVRASRRSLPSEVIGSNHLPKIREAWVKNVNGIALLERCRLEDQNRFRSCEAELRKERQKVSALLKERDDYNNTIRAYQQTYGTDLQKTMGTQTPFNQIDAENLRLSQDLAHNKNRDCRAGERRNHYEFSSVSPAVCRRANSTGTTQDTTVDQRDYSMFEIKHIEDLPSHPQSCDGIPRGRASSRVGVGRPPRASTAPSRHKKMTRKVLTEDWMDKDFSVAQISDDEDFDKVHVASDIIRKFEQTQFPHRVGGRQSMH